MAEAAGGWNFRWQLFPDDRKGSGKLQDYALESLPGKYVVTVQGNYVGKILKANATEVVLLDGDRIPRTTWPLYRALDRPPEDALETRA